MKFALALLSSTVLALALTGAMAAGEPPAPVAAPVGQMDAYGNVKVVDRSNALNAPGYCRIQVTTSAALLSSLLSTASCAAIPSWASVAYLTPESSGDANGIALRWRADGTDPTSTIGDPMFGYVKDPSILGYNAVINASLISATGASVTVSVRIGG